MIDEDSQLLASYARDKDPAAFQRLVQNHIQFAYAAAFRQTGNRQMAEDILQAVFLLLSQRAAQLKPGTLLKGWLFHATRYAAQNAKRSEFRRKTREREVAAMRSQTTPTPDDSSDIQPHLDDALACLSTRDRNALIMRYFEDMPMAALGRRMGISEHAAKKRVGRALDRLKDILQGRGVQVAGNSLALSFTVTPEISHHLIQSTIDLVTHGTSHASSVIPLAKGASKMMTQMRLKVLAMKFVLAASCMGTAAAVIVQQARPASMRSTPRATVALENPADDARAADDQIAQLQYQACRQVFTNLLDAYDHGDSAGVMSQLYFGPDADPQLIKIIPLLLDADLAVYRVQKSTVAKFGARTIGLNFYLGTIINPVIELLSRIHQKDCQFTGDTMILTPPAPFMSHGGSWPQSPMYFREIDGQWKLDIGRTIKLHVRFERRIPVPGETPLQTFAACAKMLTDGFNAIADDIDHGKITDPGDVQNHMDGVIIGISFQFSRFDIGNVEPK